MDLQLAQKMQRAWYQSSVCPLHTMTAQQAVRQPVHISSLPGQPENSTFWQTLGANPAWTNHWFLSLKTGKMGQQTMRIHPAVLLVVQ